MRKLLFILIISTNFSFAQILNNENLTFGAYGELYYSYDTSSPTNNELPAFLYNHKRHNEINLNLLLLEAAYKDEEIRSKVGIMAGTYSHYNLSSEPNWANFINEANIGVKLSKNKNLWIDVGVLPSHIGFESVKGLDCFTLTRSIIAENSPFFEAGANLNYTSNNNKLYVALLALNGWQKIYKNDGVNELSFGSQISYQFTEKLLVNYSNFYGSNDSDLRSDKLFFNNLYFKYNPTSKINFIWGNHLGFKNSNNYYGTSFITKCFLNTKISTALRYEYFLDKNAVNVSFENPQHYLNLNGLSLNFDYEINSKSTFRIEGKYYNNEVEIFDDFSNKSNVIITSSLIFRM